MGLDMFIFRKNKKEEEDTEVAYWRKEPSIHMWFNELADNKNIKYESFNCVKVPVTQGDITNLIKDIQSDINNVEKNDYDNFVLNYEASGFFWGSNSIDKTNIQQYFEWANEQVDILGKLLDYMKKNKGSYYYDSWW